jgi:hypothetical protein
VIGVFERAIEGRQCIDERIDAILDATHREAGTRPDYCTPRGRAAARARMVTAVAR